MARSPRCCGCGVGRWLSPRFDPWPEHFHVPRCHPEKKNGEKKKPELVEILPLRAVSPGTQPLSVGGGEQALCSGSLGGRSPGWVRSRPAKRLASGPDLGSSEASRAVGSGHMGAELLYLRLGWI